MTTVVTAAAGNIGRHAVSRLAEAGHTVRAVVRSHASADALRAPSVEPVVADLEAGVPPDLFDGADRALLVVPVTESLVRTANALTDAAAAAGLDRVVRVSIDSAFVEGGDVLGRAHAEADRHLAASGLRSTALRPAGFMQNLLGMAPMVQQGFIAAPTGEGEIPFVDAADIAAAAVALADKAPFDLIVIATGVLHGEGLGPEKNMKMIEGTIRKNPPANWYASFDAWSWVRSSAGSVRFSSVRIVAANTSFQESTNVNTLDAAMPGSTNGNTM